VDDVFEVLRRDHDQVRDLLERLSARSSDAADLAQELVVLESKHEAAEEMYFWPAVREKVPDGDRLADQGISQEDDGKRLLEAVRTDGSPGDEFERRISELVENVRQHIAYEEDRVWPALEGVLSTEERIELGDSVDKGKRMGPLEPHPD
jgi:hemerythrin-like domain-containing protein